MFKLKYLSLLFVLLLSISVVSAASFDIIEIINKEDKYTFDFIDINSKADYIKDDDSLLLTNEVNESIQVKYINNENDGIIEKIIKIFTSDETNLLTDKITKDVSADVQL